MSFRSIRIPGLPSQARRPAAPHAGDSAKKEKHMKEIRDGPHVALVRVHGHVDRKAATEAARGAPDNRHGKGDAMGPPAYMTVDAFCAMVYGPNWDATDKSRKSKRDTVSRMCRDGVLACRKVGRRWLIEM